MELRLGIAVVSYARIYALSTIILTCDGFVKRLFNNTDTHLAKERGWQQIVEEVNAVSQVKRSKEEIKRKWTYIKSETKKKNSQHKRSLNKTGGGPVDLSNEQSVLFWEYLDQQQSMVLVAG
ncbi:Hypothetical predicted protein [Mytilus galloprovincialis]|uniref:Myb/SANT-like DNA-binding domain-containing protein n=1 Tax=Mytilus galloprovincialis TaxID=29158 RepID=A0A8B6E887_MYTGA|nr:Hypothetical predicted protein [Mytilus galloprovincialis]